MKYPSGVGGSSISRWRFKSTVKAFLICLFAFSAIFITYQLIYYMNLTEYQFNENQSRQLELRSEEKSTSEKALNDDRDNLVVVHEGRVDNRRGKPNSFGRKAGKPLLTSKILGVNPSDLHLYLGQSNKKVFKCFSTSKKIAWDKVNDDYCDCPYDGSDEPSTAACISGQFHCVRKDGIKGYIPSSRVNDGICDCKDGTDEHAGYVKCKVV